MLVDSHASSGWDIIAIACDKVGSAHIFWDCGSDVCETRFDQWGYRVVDTKVVDDRWTGAGNDAAADMDSQGNAHLLYRMGSSPAHMVYAMFTETGLKAISLDELYIGEAYTSRYRQLAVDGGDNVHLVWSEEEGTDRLYYTKLAAISEESIAALEIGQPHWDGSVNDSHKPSLAVDSHNNAIILWNRADPSELYLEKINPSGSSVLDDYPIFPEWVCCYHQDIVVDQSDQFHLWVPTDWGSSLVLNAIGIFNNNGSIVEPMKWAMYGRKSYSPELMVDSQDDFHLVYQLKYNTMDEPPCPVNYICYESTAFNSNAYNRTLPDIGVDTAHLSWSPSLARWGETLVVTTNGSPNTRGMNQGARAATGSAATTATPNT